MIINLRFQPIEIELFKQPKQKQQQQQQQKKKNGKRTPKIRNNLHQGRRVCQE